MAKVLVTGACGQVGSRLVRQLIERKYEVRALILPDDPNRKRLAGLDIEIVEGNLLDLNITETVVKGINAVIHTANLVSPIQGMTQSEFFHNNVLSTYNIVSAASHAGTVMRFVHTSSSAVYPNDTQIIDAAYHPVDELHPLRPIGTYAATKLAGENALEALARESGMAYSIIRPSGILSGTSACRVTTAGFIAAILRSGQANRRSSLYMSDGNDVVRDLLEKSGSPDRPCAITDLNGFPWLYQPVHAADVALGLICALEHPAAVGEAFNVAAPQPFHMPDGAKLLAELTGKAIFSYGVPVRWIFDLSIVKAKSLIGYNPQWDMEKIIKSAVAISQGKVGNDDIVA